MGKTRVRNRFRPAGTPCRHSQGSSSKYPALSEAPQGSKEDLLRVAQEFGLEGLVAQRLNSVYKSGRRSGAWGKIKVTKAQEFVIDGYTLPEGNRKLL